MWARLANDVFVDRHCKCTWLLHQAHGVGHTALGPQRCQYHDRRLQGRWKPLPVWTRQRHGREYQLRLAPSQRREPCGAAPSTTCKSG